MSLPTVTLTGTFLTGEGPATGEVALYLTSPMVDAADNVIVPVTKIVLPLSAAGKFSTMIVPSDAAGLAPNPVPYQVVERIAGGGPRRYQVVVPSGSGTVDLSDLAPVGTPPDPPSAYTLLGDFAAEVAARGQGDAALASAITTEAGTRATADTTNANAIAAEAIARASSAATEAAARIAGDALAAPLAADTQWAVAGPAYTNPRPAVDLLMHNGGAGTITAYDTGGSDSTSDLQAAYTAAAANIAAGAGSQRIILNSRQRYSVAGAVTAGPNKQWSQIQVPVTQTAKGVITLVGMPGDGLPYLGLGKDRTVIESTLGSAPSYVASRGIASTIGGPASYRNDSDFTFTKLELGFDNVIFRSAAPVIAGVDAGYVNGFHVPSLLGFDTDQIANYPGGSAYHESALTVCTAPQAIACIQPFKSCWTGSLVETMFVSGWAHGIKLGEALVAKRVYVYAVAGAALLLDVSAQFSRIDAFYDWDNNTGIGDAVPSSATVIGPSLTGTGSGQASVRTTQLRIGSWHVEEAPAGNSPAALARVYDLLDSGNTTQIEADLDRNIPGTGAVAATPKLVGAGGSIAGLLSHSRVRDFNRQIGPTGPPTLPASGSLIRNPYGRDAMVTIYGDATLSLVQVNGTAVPVGTVLVPASGNLVLTYTSGTGPSWFWNLT